jgi:hypothetical protein
LGGDLTLFALGVEIGGAIRDTDAQAVRGDQDTHDPTATRTPLVPNSPLRLRGLARAHQHGGKVAIHCAAAVAVIDGAPEAAAIQEIHRMKPPSARHCATPVGQHRLESEIQAKAMVTIVAIHARLAPGRR